MKFGSENISEIFFDRISVKNGAAIDKAIIYIDNINMGIESSE
jgi:hypothetical protein